MILLKENTSKVQEVTNASLSRCKTSNGVSLQGNSRAREVSQHRPLATPPVKRLDLKLTQDYKAVFLSSILFYFPKGSFCVKDKNPITKII